MEVTKIWPAGAEPRGYATRKSTELDHMDFSEEVCGHADLDHEPELKPIILAGTDGDDYTVLDKVDPRVKHLAVHGVVGKHQSVEIDAPFMEEGKILPLPAPSNYPKVKATVSADRPDSDIIQEANEDTLNEAYGDGGKILTPENKHWILRNMGFKGLGHGRWKHVLFDQEIGFDLQTDSLTQLAFRIFKAGYYNAHNEWSSQQKTGQA